MFYDHYPYTNFHNVNLDWVLQAVKAWGHTVEVNDRAFKDLEEANESFKAFVTGYLQNLDVYDEISDKLDQMLADGVLAPYMAPYIQSDVSAWLTQHITPTTPAVDNSLTVSGAAADAKATGDRLRTIEVDMPTVYSTLAGENLLKFASSSKTSSGVVYTEDPATGSVTANGTATNNAIYNNITIKPTKSGYYTLSGCPSGGGASYYYVRIQNVTGNDYGEGVKIYLEGDTVYTLWIVVTSGKTVSNLVFNPSLIYAGETLSDIYSTVNLNLEATNDFINGPLYVLGAIGDSDGLIFVGNNFSTLGYSARTNIIYLTAGSMIQNKSNTNLVLKIFHYRSFKFDTYMDSAEYSGTRFTATIESSGFYAFSLRTSTYTQITDPATLGNMLTYNLSGRVNKALDITFIGTGDKVSECAFIVFPNGKTLMIDSGYKADWTRIRSTAYTKGYKKLDYFILSHWHVDHSGGIIQCINDNILNVSDTIFYLPDRAAAEYAYNNGLISEGTADNYLEFKDLITSHNLHVVYPATEWEQVKIDDAYIAFFNVDQSYYEGVSTNYNDWSLCNYIFYGNMNVCFTGDIGPIAEAHLAGTLYKANVYKAEHHGWANHTEIPAGYIDYVTPDVIISCDGAIHDTYLQTDRAPLEQWAEDYCVPFYRTYQNGSINISMTRDSWQITTKAKRYIKAHNPIPEPEPETDTQP